MPSPANRPDSYELDYGLSVEEIARREHCSYQRIQQILRRATAKVREELERRNIRNIEDIAPD